MHTRVCVCVCDSMPCMCQMSMSGILHLYHPTTYSSSQDLSLSLELVPHVQVLQGPRDRTHIFVIAASALLAELSLQDQGYDFCFL